MSFINGTPKNQRPELWDIYNTPHPQRRKHPCVPFEQLDRTGRMAIHPLGKKFLSFRFISPKYAPTVNIDGQLIMPDDDRLPEKYRDKIEMKKIRFRTLGCWPLTGAIESEADTIEKIVEEMMTTTQKRTHYPVSSTSTKKPAWRKREREGYF